MPDLLRHDVNMYMFHIVPKHAVVDAIRLIELSHGLSRKAYIINKIGAFFWSKLEQLFGVALEHKYHTPGIALLTVQIEFARLEVTDLDGNGVELLPFFTIHALHRSLPISAAKAGRFYQRREFRIFFYQEFFILRAVHRHRHAVHAIHEL